jgi:hypothetical protein
MKAFRAALLQLTLRGVVSGYSEDYAVPVLYLDVNRTSPGTSRDLAKALSDRLSFVTPLFKYDRMENNKRRTFEQWLNSALDYDTRDQLPLDQFLTNLCSFANQLRHMFTGEYGIIANVDLRVLNGGDDATIGTTKFVLVFEHSADQMLWSMLLNRMTIDQPINKWEVYNQDNLRAFLNLPESEDA